MHCLFTILLFPLWWASTARAGDPGPADLKADWTQLAAVMAKHAVIRVGFSDPQFAALAQGDVLRTLSDTEEGLAAAKRTQLGSCRLLC